MRAFSVLAAEFTDFKCNGHKHVFQRRNHCGSKTFLRNWLLSRTVCLTNEKPAFYGEENSLELPKKPNLIKPANHEMDL